MRIEAGQPVTAEARIRPLRPSDFAPVRARGCTRVRAITSPVNTGSVAFHRRMGFRLEPGDVQVDGIPVATGYDGPGQDRVRFVRDLPACRPHLLDDS